jgi:hypothetical protein
MVPWCTGIARWPFKPEKRVQLSSGLPRLEMSHRLEVQYQKALRLRKNGMPVKRIARTLGIGVGTSSTWCREIVLSKTAKARLHRNIKAAHAASILFHIKQSQARRQKAFDEGFNRAAKDEIFRLICALYWAEGSKRDCGFHFCNSDSAMILFVARWLGRESTSGKCGLTVVFYTGNGISSRSIKKHWKRAFHLMPTRSVFKLRHATVSKASKRIAKRKIMYGTANIRVNSVDLLYKVLGGIHFLASSNGKTLD